ncbi:MAG: hypothetical protein ACOVO1_05025 [Chitinophagaceae bacterium]
MCLVLVSCGRNKEDEKLFEELNASLESSNKLINAKSVGFMMTMEEKMQDSRTHYIAIKWQPKARFIEKKSNEIIAYLNSLNNKASFRTEKKYLQKLHKELIEYKQQMQELDSAMYNDLSKDIKITSEIGEANEQTEAEFCNSFNESNQLLKLAIYKNRIVRIKSSLIEYCEMNTRPGCVLNFESFRAIAAQNSTKFKPAETLEITAGVGAFSKAASPKVFVNNKEVVLNSDGVAEFKETVPSKPGKYYKQVKIKYIKPDGTIGAAEKEIIYTVDE